MVATYTNLSPPLYIGVTVDVEDVFGNIIRPESPDFWSLSEIILQMDGKFEENPSQKTFTDLVNSRCDLDSITYMAFQRAFRILNISTSKEALDKFEQVSKLTALYIEAFVVGSTFEERKQQRGK